jgi:hypothetical protein
VVEAIESTLLVRERDFDRSSSGSGGGGGGGAVSPALGVSELYDLLETKRLARLNGLVQKYASLQSLLIKVRQQLPLLCRLPQTGVEQSSITGQEPSRCAEARS